MSPSNDFTYLLINYLCYGNHNTLNSDFDLIKFKTYKYTFTLNDKLYYHMSDNRGIIIMLY
jgi:hypothetical protein